MDVCALPELPRESRQLLSLPAEIRIAILEYVFSDNLCKDGFTHHRLASCGIVIDEDYSAHHHLQPLSVCRQMYADGNILALNRTSFVISNLFFHIPDRLALLHPKQVAAIRNISFVADARHFRKLLDWGYHPFGVPSLHLDTLTVILHRSSFWHYLFDFTSDIVTLLRELEGVRRFVFVRNDARVKGSFKTWYNRLVDLMMKVDHRERFERDVPHPEKIWWRWSFDEAAQSCCFDALPPKPMMDARTYETWMEPLKEELRISKENEEWNPDPRSRNGA